jgi:hypothetical protein
VEAAINQGPSTEGFVRFSCRVGSGQCNIFRGGGIIRVLSQ